MNGLIKKNPSNASRILPFMGGDELSNSPGHAHHRYVIDFADYPLRRESLSKSWSAISAEDRRECLLNGIVPDDYDDPVAADWPDLVAIVEALVKPERLKQKDKVGRRFWWRFLRRRDQMYAAIANLSQVLAVSRVAKHLCPAFLANGMVYSLDCIVFAFDSFAPLAALHSRTHETWTRFFASSLEDRLRYTPSDCFRTFPFPVGFETLPALEAAGQVYHDHRAALMVAHDEGMTKTYNRFHDPDERRQDIVRLRKLHAEMDRAVLRAYGWDDLAERAEPIFLDDTNEDDHTYQGRLFWPSAFRDEVLARLLALNAERHAEELRRGVAPRDERQGAECGCGR